MRAVRQTVDTLGSPLTPNCAQRRPLAATPLQILVAAVVQLRSAADVRRAFAEAAAELD